MEEYTYNAKGNRVRRRYTYHNGVKVYASDKPAPHYLIKHDWEIEITPEGALKMKRVPCDPPAGVEITSLNNAKYVVGPKENIVRIV